MCLCVYHISGCLAAELPKQNQHSLNDSHCKQFDQALLCFSVLILKAKDSLLKIILLKEEKEHRRFV